MKNNQSYSTWVEVSLSAIDNNIRLLRESTGVQVMAVVKGNAYGHGVWRVSEAAIQAGASWLGVARIEEAVELRNYGLDCPILLMGYLPINRFNEAISKHISLTVWEEEQIRLASASAQSLGQLARVHLKVDTGMSRLGVQVDDAFLFANGMASTPGIILEGIFTHFASADIPSDATTVKQIQLFNRLLMELDSVGLRPKLVHAANSAASLTRPDAAYTMIRSGIAMYGLHPSIECLLPDRFQPVLTWKTVLSQVKVLPPGRGVSYGHEYFTATYERVGTLPVGYADGFRRIKGNQVLVSGKRVPVIGRVCMDQCSVQLDSVPDAHAGDEVVLIGSQADSVIRTEEVAKKWNTNNYEVVCGIATRVPRLYY